MLTKQLRELEQDGIILLKVYAQVPPKVEYSLTEFGQTLMPILKELERWVTTISCNLNKYALLVESSVQVFSSLFRAFSHEKSSR